MNPSPDSVQTPHSKPTACWRWLIGLAASILGLQAVAAGSVFDGGHLKYAFTYTDIPEDSLFRDAGDNAWQDQQGTARLKFAGNMDNVRLTADYQLIALQGDRVEIYSSLPASPLLRAPVLDDSRRLMDLTSEISSDDDSVLVHRLDRLAIDVSAGATFLRVGRQAISWGNGIFYTPMDFFNPFDPAAVDTEYKTGDDMVYAQHLLDSGDDLQGVWVVRRDDAGDMTSEVNSLALKYHLFSNVYEMDLLISQHYDDTILAIGGLTNVGEAVWRGDVSVSVTDDDEVLSLVTNLTYSWIGWGRNMSGVVEYYYNGFGQPADQYDPASLATNPALVERIARGELFTLGRNYLAGSLLIEITPMWQLTPNAFINLGDGSMLAQLVSTYDIVQDLQLLAALNAPIGPAGSEFGGIDSSVAGKQLSTGPSLFAQLAYYF